MHTVLPFVAVFDMQSVLGHIGISVHRGVASTIELNGALKFKETKLKYVLLFTCHFIFFKKARIVFYFA